MPGESAVPKQSFIECATAAGLSLLQCPMPPEQNYGRGSDAPVPPSLSSRGSIQPKELHICCWKIPFQFAGGTPPLFIQICAWNLLLPGDP